MPLPVVMRRLAILALLAAQSAAALGMSAADPVVTAFPSRAEAKAYRAWRGKAIKVLVSRGDANSLATAAALSFTGSGAKTNTPPSAASTQDLAARAGELAPQSAAIGWMRLSLCAGSLSCDIRGVATAMRWVDADNGAAWLPTLAAAQRDRDAREVDRVLADMAQGSRFDLYWNSIVVLMFDALKTARKDLPGGYAASDSARLAAVFGIAAAEMIPPFAPVMDACRESAPERRDWCLKISKTMQRGDAIVTQMLGFALEKRLAASDSREARLLADRRRVLEWRRTATAGFDSPLLPWTRNARARARLSLMRAMPREEDVCVAILREHNKPTEPPEAHP